jgi:competence protein ComEC
VACLGLVLAGWLGLSIRPRAQLGAAAWSLVLVATLTWRLVLPAPSRDQVVVLPVSDGTSVLVVHTGASMLLDGGRLHDEAAEVLARAGVRRLELVVASHADEDHVGGLERVLETVQVRRLVMPAWMQARPAAVPLLRAARRRGTLIVPVSRGTSVSLGREALQVLWPPMGGQPAAGSDNDLSIAALLQHSSGAVLLLGDQGAGVEARLAAISTLRCGVLLAAHHGSRSSTSATLLDAARPGIVLVPAGPGNLHGHPHHSVLQRLDSRRIPYRCPVRDGRCGAVPFRGHWRPFP